MSKGTILSGMRPTGKLHLGHLMVLENWQRLQEEYKCYFMVADWHALTSDYASPQNMSQNTIDLVIDWLCVGLDPEKSVIFVQSQVKEHAELHLLFSMLTPLSWLERVPTYKDQVYQLGLQGKDLNTYGFLGYPLLQAADILAYKGNAVPVGEDQLPHIELCREVARRFNFLYNKEIFPEPKGLVAKIALVPGVDGRKMSKSYGNAIEISAVPEDIFQKVRSMITDPARIHKTDPGHPEVCTVHTYHGIYLPGEAEDIGVVCKKGEIGCVACKKKLAEAVEGALAPYREKRRELEDNPGLVREILHEGNKRAREAASATLEEVREAMGL